MVELVRLHQPLGIAAPRHPAEPALMDEPVVDQRVDDPVKEDAEPDPRARLPCRRAHDHRSEEHTSELQSLMRISYAVFRLKKNTHTQLNISRHFTTIQLDTI